MVEARWLRWFGPGLRRPRRQLGAGRLDDGRGRDAAVGSGVSAAGRRRRGRLAAPRSAARRALADDSAAHRGSASTRSSTAMARWPVSGWRSASTATRAPGPSTCRPSRSPPGRSGASSWSAADDGVRSTLRAARRRRPAAPGRSRPSANVIRRATIDRGGYRRSTRCGSTARHAPTWGSGFGRSTAASPPARSWPPPAPDGRFGRTWSTEFAWDLAGDRLAVQSCGDVACRTRILDPDGGPTAMLDAPDLGSARSASTATGS